MRRERTPFSGAAHFFPQISRAHISPNTQSTNSTTDSIVDIYPFDWNGAKCAELHSVPASLNDYTLLSCRWNTKESSSLIACMLALISPRQYSLMWTARILHSSRKTLLHSSLERQTNLYRRQNARVRNANSRLKPNSSVCDTWTPLFRCFVDSLGAHRYIEHC